MKNNNMKDFCKEHNITENQFKGIDKIEGSLNLGSLTSIPDTFNPTVGGSLNLYSLTSIPDTFNPTVGGCLYLPKGLSCNKTKLSSNYLFSWQDGKYIKVDGIFTEVVKKKGNVYHVKKLNDDKVFYLITDGERWSHGDTLQEAKVDLVYKVTNKTKDDYKDLTLSSVLSFEEAVVCYRVLTGACSFGVKDFVKNKLDKVEKEYSIETIIEKTIGCYGNENFKEYFK